MKEIYFDNNKALSRSDGPGGLAIRRDVYKIN